ncbi:hypothetical protein Tco_0065418 [Tanacetum coccineum]
MPASDKLLVLMENFAVESYGSSTTIVEKLSDISTPATVPELHLADKSNISSKPNTSLHGGKVICTNDPNSHEEVDVMWRSWMAVMEIMPIDQVLFDQFSSSHVHRAFNGAFKRPSTGPSRRRPGGFEEKAGGFEEKAGGLLQTQQRLDSIREGCPLSSMYGPCLPYGKYVRMQRRLQATLKVTGRYKGCNRGYYKGYMLLRRQSHKWQATTNVA